MRLLRGKIRRSAASTRSYGCPPAIVRLLLAAEAVAMDWIGVDPLLVRAVAFDLRMRLAFTR